MLSYATIYTDNRKRLPQMRSYLSITVPGMFGVCGAACFTAASASRPPDHMAGHAGVCRIRVSTDSMLGI